MIEGQVHLFGKHFVALRLEVVNAQIDKLLCDHVHLTFYHELLASYSHAIDLSPEDIAAALAYLLQKERPLQVKFAPLKPAKEHPRAERAERAGKGKKFQNDEDMQRYRIEVGRTHHVKPGDIVGALANEAGIASRQIGHIKLFDDFSTVDLPKTLAKETLRQLKTLRVRNQVLDIRIDEGPGGESFAPRRRNDKKFDRRPKKSGKAAAKK